MEEQFRFPSNAPQLIYHELLKKVSGLVHLRSILATIGKAALNCHWADGLAISLENHDKTALSMELVMLPERLFSIHDRYLGCLHDISHRDESVQVFMENKVMVFDHASISNAHEDIRDRFFRWQLHSLAMIPLRHEGRPVGTIWACRETEAMDTNSIESVQAFFEYFSLQIVNGAENTRLREKAEEIDAAANERLQFLEFAAELNNLTSSDQIFQMVADEFLRRFPFDVAFFNMVDGDYLFPRCFRAATQEVESLRLCCEDYAMQLGKYRLQIEDGIIPQCAIKNIPIFIRDAREVTHLPMRDNDKRFVDSLLARGGSLISVLLIPICLNQKPIGVLTLESMRNVVELTPADIEFMKLLCSFTGTAIENARVYHQVAEQKAEIENTLIALKATQEQLIETERKRADALEQGKAEAERANDAKSRFLAAASHDLRQPLFALGLYVGILKSKVTVENAPLVDSIKGCISNLSELLTDLLNISKLEAGVVTPAISNFAIGDILDKLVSQHAREAELKGLCLRNVACSLTTRTDPVLYGRIIGNILANAIRYTEQGGVLLACRRHQGKRWLEIWDTGIGIPEDKTTEIFEEFKQLGNDARTRGSGLGLAIVAKTAALLGLQIRVRSRLGKGSLFAVELPLGWATKAMDRVMATPTVEPCRIALVEDNVGVLNALVCSLENNGHQVVAAASGRELMERLGSLSPDIVISDYRLTDKETGFDVISAVRTAFNDRLPAIIVTGDTDPKLMSSMAQRGILIQHKPIEIDTLELCIAEATKGLLAKIGLEANGTLE